MKTQEIEIRCYTHNGANWEFCGLAWFAEKLTTNGDWSAFDNGESVMLRSFDGEEQIGEIHGEVRDGELVVCE